jgi:hypothetical protein
LAISEYFSRISKILAFSFTANPGKNEFPVILKYYISKADRYSPFDTNISEMNYEDPVTQELLEDESFSVHSMTQFREYYRFNSTKEGTGKQGFTPISKPKHMRWGISTSSDCLFVATGSGLDLNTQLVSPLLTYPANGVNDAQVTVIFSTANSSNGLKDVLIDSNDGDIFEISVIILNEQNNILDKVPFYSGNTIPWTVETVKLNRSIFHQPMNFRVGFDISINGSKLEVLKGMDRQSVGFRLLDLNLHYARPVVGYSSQLNRFDNWQTSEMTRRLEEDETDRNYAGTLHSYTNMPQAVSSLTDAEFASITSAQDPQYHYSGIEDFSFATNPFATAINPWNRFTTIIPITHASGERTAIFSPLDYFNTNSNTTEGVAFNYHTTYEMDGFIGLTTTPALKLSAENKWAGLSINFIIPEYSGTTVISDLVIDCDLAIVSDSTVGTYRYKSLLVRPDFSVEELTVAPWTTAPASIGRNRFNISNPVGGIYQFINFWQRVVVYFFS